jgi:hypothetical protein
MPTKEDITKKFEKLSLQNASDVLPLNAEKRLELPLIEEWSVDCGR